MDIDMEEDNPPSCIPSSNPEERRESCVSVNSKTEVPEKNREVYERKYNEFMQWLKKKDSTEISESTLLDYFYELPARYKAPTLYSIYSMLRPMIHTKHNINISTYTELLAYLRKNLAKYKPQSSSTLSREQLNKFFKEADDDRYLMIKVALIFGICGGCRLNELYNIKEQDIKEIDDTLLMVLINDTKLHKPRTFPVINDAEVNYIALYRKYAELRKDKPIRKERFFLKYANKRCYNQVVGIHTFGKIPPIIAEFLKLENPDSYNGHCFRRSSKSLVANARADNSVSKKSTEDPLAINIEETSSISAPSPAALSVSNTSVSAMDEVNIQNEVNNVYIKQELSIPNSVGSSPSRSPSHVSSHHPLDDINTRNGEIHLHNCTNITININHLWRINK